jgi:hypothetical protein
MAFTKIRATEQLLIESIDNTLVANSTLTLAKMVDGTALEYLLNKSAASSVKLPVNAVTVANAANITDFAAVPQALLDPVELAVGARILVKGQTDKKQNGLYKVDSVSGSIGSRVYTISRSVDAAAGMVNAIAVGAIVVCKAGTFAGQIFECIGQEVNGQTAIGTSQLEFVRISGLGDLTSAGPGISITADDEISVLLDPTDCLSFNNGMIKMSTSAFTTKYEKTGLTPVGAVDNSNVTYALITNAIKGTVKLYLNGNRIEGGISASFTDTNWDYRIDTATNNIIMKNAPVTSAEGTDKLRYDCFVSA